MLKEAGRKRQGGRRKDELFTKINNRRKFRGHPMQVVQRRISKRWTFQCTPLDDGGVKKTDSEFVILSPELSQIV